MTEPPLSALWGQSYSCLHLVTDMADNASRSSRGNHFLESAVPLAKALHRQIVRLAKRLNDAATAEEVSRAAGLKRSSRTADAHHAELLLIIRDMKELMAQIDRDIPLISLAITTSGEKLPMTVHSGISPSRLLQASTFINFADLDFAHNPNRAVQVGPSFTLSLYMLFLGHSQPVAHPPSKERGSPSTPDSLGQSAAPKEQPYGLEEGEKKPIWKEVMHKARVRLCRTPFDWHFNHKVGYHPNSDTSWGRPNEYSYCLEVIEDLQDGRVHDDEGEARPAPFDGVSKAGMRESIPLGQISKIFYADTGKILNIQDAAGGDNSPILLLKRDVRVKPRTGPGHPWEADEFGAAGDASSVTSDQDDIDRQLFEESKSSVTPALGLEASQQAGGLPQDLDPEWLALEVFIDDEYDDDDDDDSDSDGSEVEDGADGDERDVLTNGHDRGKPGLDLDVASQLRQISLEPNFVSPSRGVGRSPGRQVAIKDSWVEDSPVSSIVSSLSLLEMLIRITSLQEYQQISHLAIQDEMLMFFLEESATTGLPQGEERWKLRQETRRRVGFDPFTDSPIR